MSRIIGIDDIQDGDILKEPVMNNFGQVLLGSGIVLAERHKRLLKTWNIATVNIKGGNTENEEQISEEILILAKEHFIKRVNWEPRNNNEQELFLMGINHFAKKMQAAK